MGPITLTMIKNNNNKYYYCYLFIKHWYRLSLPAFYKMCAIHLTSVCGLGTFSGVAAGLAVASDSKPTLRFFTTAYREKHVTATNLLQLTELHTIWICKINDN